MFSKKILTYGLLLCAGLFLAGCTMSDQNTDFKNKIECSDQVFNRKKNSDSLWYFIKESFYSKSHNSCLVKYTVIYDGYENGGLFDIMSNKMICSTNNFDNSDSQLEARKEFEKFETCIEANR